MDDLSIFMESGILEAYVMGCASPAEVVEVEAMAATHAVVREEIDAIAAALEAYAVEQAVTPEDPTLKTFLMATINYMERLKNGEQPSFPPMLGLDSKKEDFEPWINRPDLQPPHLNDGAYARIIGHTPQATTAIVWLKYGAPPETHTDQLEKFLVLEGTCDITIGNDVHSMVPGDVLVIPLHLPHHVRVTSEVPCKVILQRVAA